IREFQQAPPKPGAVQPRIRVEDGIVLLATDYGRVRLNADASLADGRLQQLAAKVAPTRLAGDGFDLSVGEVGLKAQASGRRVEVSLDAPIVDARLGQASAPRAAATGARLRVTAAGPYPDLRTKRLDGAVAAHAELSGGRMAAAGQALRNGVLSAA